MPVGEALVQPGQRHHLRLLEGAGHHREDGQAPVVRTSADPAAMLRGVQREIAAVDPMQPAYGS